METATTLMTNYTLFPEIPLTMTMSSGGTSESSDTSSPGIIIGIVLGTCTAILAVFVVLLLVAYTRRKRRLDKNK